MNDDGFHFLMFGEPNDILDENLFKLVMVTYDCGTAPLTLKLNVVDLQFSINPICVVLNGKF